MRNSYTKLTKTKALGHASIAADQPYIPWYHGKRVRTGPSIVIVVEQMIAGQEPPGDIALSHTLPGCPSNSKGRGREKEGGKKAKMPKVPSSSHLPEFELFTGASCWSMIDYLGFALALSIVLVYRQLHALWILGARQARNSSHRQIIFLFYRRSWSFPWSPPSQMTPLLTLGCRSISVLFPPSIYALFLIKFIPKSWDWRSLPRVASNRNGHCGQKVMLGRSSHLLHNGNMEE